MRGWGGCLGTNPFRGAARCGTSEAISHKDATTARNSLTRLSPRSRRELRRGADLGTRTPAVDPTCRSANPVFRLHPRCATRLQRLSDFPRFTRASSALHSRFSRVSMAPHSEGSKNSYMDQCTLCADDLVKRGWFSPSMAYPVGGAECAARPLTASESVYCHTPRAIRSRDCRTTNDLCRATAVPRSQYVAASPYVRSSARDGPQCHHAWAGRGGRQTNLSVRHDAMVH
jgi:hypothetical protein